MIDFLFNPTNRLHKSILGALEVNENCEINLYVNKNFNIYDLKIVIYNETNEIVQKSLNFKKTEDNYNVYFTVISFSKPYFLRLKASCPGSPPEEKFPPLQTQGQSEQPQSRIQQAFPGLQKPEQEPSLQPPPELRQRQKKLQFSANKEPYRQQLFLRQSACFSSKRQTEGQNLQGFPASVPGQCRRRSWGLSAGLQTAC